MALPRGTTGSLDPTFVPARLVSLTVKPAYALALHSGFPIRSSRSPRQSLYHSTIRAGRNLPDKEFRYLRTVIVTAAVHRGFSSSLRPCGLSPCFNLPAPGRCHPLYVVFDFAESCVFVKQLQSAIHCDRFGL